MMSTKKYRIRLTKDEQHELMVAGLMLATATICLYPISN